MKFASLLVPALLLVTGSSAMAQPGNTAPGQVPPDRNYLPVPQLQRPTAPTTETRSYGLHVFLADAATWAAIAATENSGSGQFVGLGLLFGGPIVHLAHGNAAGAGASLLARVSLPGLGLMVGSATCSEAQEDEFFGCLGPMLGGMMVGYGAALVLDWFYIARKEVPVAPTGWSSLQPTLRLGTDSAQAGLAFAF